MDHSVHKQRLGGHALLSYLFLGIFIHGVYSIYHYESTIYSTMNPQITKVQLTQKGYIQFLRYVEDVPSITEYTFCIWVKSYDLSHSHPILSYSRNEKERLIRVWISPRGKSINLELHGHPVFKIPTELREHQWYHLCQSWDASTATWEFFINDRKFRGRAPKLTGLVIRGGGDIVIAQEYTDFNKGLEDGIEGEIFGFNFVLSATSKAQKLPRYSAPSTSAFDDYYRRRRSYAQRQAKHRPLYTPNSDLKFPTFGSLPLWWDNAYLPSLKSFPSKIVRMNPSDELFAFPMFLSEDDRFRNVIHKSTGLKLVEMSKNCRIGKGGPLHGKRVLINWTDTRVRVFGGAIMKQVEPFC